ncbi:MAG: hypothetical protein HDQ88_04555, partial [Clostridia bacterium]|nr:hypothetical protein [Clostridia bacterium]
KGTAIQIPVGISAPVAVYGNGKVTTLTDGNTIGYLAQPNTSGATAIRTVGGKPTGNPDMPNVGTLTENVNGNFDNKGLGIWAETTYGASGIIGTADLRQAQGIDVNQFRTLVATQRILERDATGGTRINEVIKSQFGVTINNLEIQVPEYLGGKRIPINISQITQVSETTNNSALGELGAQSLTYDLSTNFIKSFQEWGTILGLVVIRQNHIYQQGISRQFFRKRRLDYYWPEMAYLGEQAIYNKEIYAQGTEQDEEVFGYQQRYAEYRYKNWRISGEFSSMYETPLDEWHLADYYASLPMLGPQWIQETPDNVDRCLQVKSTIADQWMFDIAVLDTAARPMPVNPIAGLVDHY